MGYGVAECSNGLAGESTAASIGYRARYHYGQRRALCLEAGTQSKDSRLCIQCIEGCLDHDDIGATLDQASDRVTVIVHQSIKTDVSKARIAHFRRDGGCLARRS